MEATNIILFKELTDDIYWEGYAEELASTDPARFNAELNLFTNNI